MLRTVHVIQPCYQKQIKQMTDLPLSKTDWSPQIVCRQVNASPLYCCCSHSERSIALYSHATWFKIRSGQYNQINLSLQWTHMLTMSTHSPSAHVCLRQMPSTLKPLPSRWFWAFIGATMPHHSLTVLYSTFQQGYYPCCMTPQSGASLPFGNRQWPTILQLQCQIPCHEMQDGERWWIQLVDDAPTLFQVRQVSRNQLELQVL